MSGSLTTRVPAAVEITSWSPTLISRAHSLKTQRRVRGAGVQRWRISYRYPPLEHDDYADLWAFLNAQRGQSETFTLTLPSQISPRGVWAGSPLASADHAAGVSSVAIDGLTVGTTGKRGDFVKFAAHSKVYQLTADFTADGSGAATLAIMPALNAAVANNSAISATAVPFTVILESDEMPLSLQAGNFGSIGFTAIEDY